MTFLHQGFFVNVEHLHVFEGLFEEVDSVFVIGVEVVGLSEHVGASDVEVCFVLVHLDFLFGANLSSSFFLIRDVN